MLFLFVLPVAAALVLVAFVSYLAYIHLQHLKYGHIPGPKRKSFIYGSSDIFQPVFEKKTTIAELTYELHKQYGPIFCVFILHHPFISALDPEAIKELLTDNSYVKPYDSYKFFHKVYGQRFMGYGLVSELDNTKWARHRKLFNPAFHRKYLMQLMDIFDDSADRLASYLSLRADDKTEVKLLHAFERVTLDVIAKAGFGMEGDMVANDTEFSGAIGLAFESMVDARENLFYFLNPSYSAYKYRVRARKAIKFLRDTGEDIIRRRIEDQGAGKKLPKDILSYIVEAAVVENFTLTEMVDEFVTFFGAGQETTATLLAFTMFCLGQNPEVLQRAVREVDSVIGKKENIEYDDIIKLEYLSLVLKETLRLYPPVFGTGRDLPTDKEIAGLIVPAGASVMFCNWALCRQEEYFKDPLTFDPERFRKAEDKPLYVYLPFSLGPRSCIGQQFAMMESKVVIAKLLQKLSFRLVPGQNLGVTERLTTRPAGGCLTYIKPRVL